jgi:hypothetical protein
VRLTAPRTALLVARAWGVKPMAKALVGVVVLSAAWRGPLTVPGRRDVAEMIWPLAPCLLAIVVPAAAARAHSDQERCAPRSGLMRRVAFVGILVATAIALAAGLGILHSFVVIARNSLFLCGLGLAASVLLPLSTRWIPASFIPIVMWLLGARSTGQDPAGWAILLHDGRSAPAAVAAALCFAVGAVLYIAADRPMRS